VLGCTPARRFGVIPPVRALLPHFVSLLRPAIGVGVLTGLAPLRDQPLLLPAVLAATATDWADGALARRLGADTRAGRVVDNLCDFLLLLLVFIFLARAEVWTPPVWGRLARHWGGANWLPVYALLASFGLYFVRLVRELVAGREPERSPRGHNAGISNYLLAVAGAVEMLPGVGLGPWLLEPAMLGVVLLNLAAVAENATLMFHRREGGPTMPA
jgi:phosphatidylglycerophosphate synthase